MLQLKQRIERQTLDDVVVKMQAMQFTISDMIRYMTSLFAVYELHYGHGTTTAYDEAVFLTLGLLRLPYEQLQPYQSSKLLDYEVRLLVEGAQLRAIERVPVAYILHEAVLHGYTFYVDKRVIIPRSYIASLLLNEVFDDLIARELVTSVLDLCTGSAALAIIAANHYTNAAIVASDVSDQALQVATINVARYGLSDTISLVQSNLFTMIDDTFDLIITNPPYVDASGMMDLTEEYIHEPRIALAGGDDGLFFVDNILRHAKNYLSESGYLIVEMGNNQQQLIDLYPDLQFLWLENGENDGYVFAISAQELKDYFD
jgi:ribosomal protein L3 glutamine methyltransferase